MCLEDRVLATPITPEALPFDPGEEMVVATTKAEAALGEYQFLFTMGDYLGEDGARAEALFDRPDWKHLYAIDSATAISPFSLADVVTSAGERGPEVEYRYKGQTQHHRIIRTIFPEDEGLWRSFIEPDTEPAWSADAVVEANAAEATAKRVKALSPAEVIARLTRMDTQNRKLAKGRAYRPGKAQQRNRKFTALLKAWYEGRCQVCGEQIADPAGTRRAVQVHHLEQWDGDRSDRLDNVIVVCPNDHARFELGLYVWTTDGLGVWNGQEWEPKTLALDKHLTVKLTTP